MCLFKKKKPIPKPGDSGFLLNDWRIVPIFINPHDFDYKCVKPAFGNESEEDVHTSLMEFYNDQPAHDGLPRKLCPHKIIHNVRNHNNQGFGVFKEAIMNFFNTSSVQFSEYVFDNDYTDDGTGSDENQKKLDELKWNKFVDHLEYWGAMRYYYGKEDPRIEVYLLFNDANIKQNYSKDNIKIGDKIRLTYYRGNMVHSYSSIAPWTITNWVSNKVKGLSHKETIEFNSTKEGTFLEFYYDMNSKLDTWADGWSNAKIIKGTILRDSDGIAHVYIMTLTPKIFDGDGYTRTYDLTKSASFGDWLLDSFQTLIFSYGPQLSELLINLTTRNNPKKKNDNKYIGLKKINKS